MQPLVPGAPDQPATAPHQPLLQTGGGSTPPSARWAATASSVPVFTRVVRGPRRGVNSHGELHGQSRRAGHRYSSHRHVNPTIDRGRALVEGGVDAVHRDRGRLSHRRTAPACVACLVSGSLLAMLTAAGLLNHVATAWCVPLRESHHPQGHPPGSKIPLGCKSVITALLYSSAETKSVNFQAGAEPCPPPFGRIGAGAAGANKMSAHAYKGASGWGGPIMTIDNNGLEAWRRGSLVRLPLTAQ